MKKLSNEKFMEVFRLIHENCFISSETDNFIGLKKDTYSTYLSEINSYTKDVLSIFYEHQELFEHINITNNTHELQHKQRIHVEWELSEKGKHLKTFLEL